MRKHQESEPISGEDARAPEPSSGRRDSRRSFLMHSAVTTAVGVPGLILAGTSKSRAASPRPKHLPNLFPGENRDILFEILQDEENHIVALGKLSDGFAGRKRPTFQNLLARSPVGFIQMAASIENGGVGSYIQGLNAISQANHDEYFLTAAGITAVEAQHTGFLNALLNQAIAPSALVDGLAKPIPPSAIRDAIVGSGFIANLNDYQDFFINGYNVNQLDDANDQRIINFSLVLEFLEVEFYRMNIARFFVLL